MRTGVGFKVTVEEATRPNPGISHIPLIERPSRKWARRISPILSTPSIPRFALPNQRKSNCSYH